MLGHWEDRNDAGDIASLLLSQRQVEEVLDPSRSLDAGFHHHAHWASLRLLTHATKGDA